MPMRDLNRTPCKTCGIGKYEISMIDSQTVLCIGNMQDRCMDIRDRFEEVSDEEFYERESALKKVLKTVRKHPFKIGCFSIVTGFIALLFIQVSEQHQYETPEREVLAELSEMYNVPRPNISVRDFNRYHWSGASRTRTIAYYMSSSETIRILPCTRENTEQWRKVLTIQFVRYYLDYTDYRGPPTSGAFNRLIRDLGYDPSDIGFNSTACAPGHRT